MANDLHFTKAVLYWIQWAAEVRYGSGLPDVTKYEDFLILQIRMPVNGSLLAVNRQLIEAFDDVFSNVRDLRGNALNWQVAELLLRGGPSQQLTRLREAGAHWPALDPVAIAEMRVDIDWQSSPWRFGLPTEWRRDAARGDDPRIPWIDGLAQPSKDPHGNLTSATPHVPETPSVARQPITTFVQNPHEIFDRRRMSYSPSSPAEGEDAWVVRIDGDKYLSREHYHRHYMHRDLDLLTSDLGGAMRLSESTAKFEAKKVAASRFRVTAEALKLNKDGQLGCLAVAAIWMVALLATSAAFLS